MSDIVTLQLKEIDLSKCSHYPESGRLTDHPDIKPGRKYIVKYGGEVYLGEFYYEWYGLNFDGIYDAGCQFDAPGTNGSQWEGVWEIIAPKPKKALAAAKRLLATTPTAGGSKETTV